MQSLMQWVDRENGYIYLQYIKYVGNVGQDLAESIFSFTDYKPIPVTQVIWSYSMKSEPDQEGDMILSK